MASGEGAAGEVPAGGVQLLIFELAGSLFALEAAVVRQVLRAVLIAPLPEGPEVIEGVISVRGTVVPVYDLRQRFGIPARRPAADERMILAWNGERMVALRCDRADRLEEVEAERISSAEAFTRGGRRIAGVAHLEDGLALIHDLRTFLIEAERETLEAALGAGEGPGTTSRGGTGGTSGAADSRSGSG